MDRYNRRHALFQIFMLCICGITLVMPRHLADVLQTKTNPDRRALIQQSDVIPSTVYAPVFDSDENSHKIRHRHAKRTHRKRSVSKVTESMSVLDSPQESTSVHATTQIITSRVDISDKNTYQEKSMEIPQTGYHANMTLLTARPKSFKTNLLSALLLTSKTTTADNQNGFSQQSTMLNLPPDPLGSTKFSVQSEYRLNRKRNSELTTLSNSNENALTSGVAIHYTTKDAYDIYTFTPIHHSENNTPQQTSHNPQQLGKNSVGKSSPEMHSTTVSTELSLQDSNTELPTTGAELQDNCSITSDNNFPHSSHIQGQTTVHSNHNGISDFETTIPIQRTNESSMLNIESSQDIYDKTPSQTTQIKKSTSLNNSQSPMNYAPVFVLDITTDQTFNHSASIVQSGVYDTFSQNDSVGGTVPYRQFTTDLKTEKSTTTIPPTESIVNSYPEDSNPNIIQTTENPTVENSATERYMAQTSPAVLDTQDNLTTSEAKLLTTSMINDTVIAYSMESSTQKVTSLANENMQHTVVNGNATREFINEESTVKSSTPFLHYNATIISTFPYDNVTQKTSDMHQVEITEVPMFTKNSTDDFIKENTTNAINKQTMSTYNQSTTMNREDSFITTSAHSNENHSDLQTSSLPVMYSTTPSGYGHLETTNGPDITTERVEISEMTSHYIHSDDNHTSVFNDIGIVTKSTLLSSGTNVTTDDPLIHEVPHPTNRVQEFAADWDKLWLFILISCCVLVATLLIFVIALITFFSLRRRKAPAKRGSTYDYYSHNSIKNHPFTDTELVYSTEVGSVSESEEMTFGTFGKSRGRDKVIMMGSNEKITSNPFGVPGVDVIRIKQMPRSSYGEKVEYV